jgi:hypothetical protein
MSSSSLPASNDRSLSCDPIILEELKKATQKDHVRQLLQRHDANAVNQAWRCLDPIERSALLLCKNLDGTIIPGLTSSDV